MAAFAWDMKKVQVAVRPPYLELGEGVQAGLLRAPIERAAPIVDETAKVVDARPIEPGLARRRIGKTGAREAVAQVHELAVRNAQCDWLGHRLLLPPRSGVSKTAGFWGKLRGRTLH